MATQTNNSKRQQQSVPSIYNPLDHGIPHLSHRRPDHTLLSTDKLRQKYVEAAKVVNAEKSVDFINPEELCARKHCSRCLGQTVAQEFLLVMDYHYEKSKMEDAAKWCQNLTDKLLKHFGTLQQLTEKSLFIIQLLALDSRRLKCFLVRFMQGLCSRKDLYGCLNVLANGPSGNLNFLSGNLVLDDICEKPDILLEFLATRASRHPASFVQQQEASMQHSWDQGWWVMNTSRCFLSLDEKNFGTVKAVHRNGLHTDGVYTYIKGQGILRTLEEVYCRFATFETELCMIFDDIVRENPSPTLLTDTMKSIGTFNPKPTQVWHLALEESKAALNPPMLKLRELILATMKSGSELESQHTDRLQWNLPRMPYAKLASDNAAYSAFHFVTFDRIFEFGTLLALIHDVTQLRNAAQGIFRRSKSKSDLLAAWETAEASVNSIMEYLGNRAVVGAFHFSHEQNEIGSKPMTLQATVDGRVQVVPEHQTSWTIDALRNSRQPLLKRIDQFLAYLDLRREEKRLLHWTADYVMELLPAVRQLVVAMEVLQPLSCREYQYTNHGLCIYSAEARKISLHSLRLIIDPQVQQMRQQKVWDALNLKTPGNLQSQCRQIWDKVIETVVQAWKQADVSPKILDQVQDLLKARDALPLEEIGHAEDLKLPDQVTVSPTDPVASAPKSKWKSKDGTQDSAVAALGAALDGFSISDRPARPSQWGDKSPVKKKVKIKRQGVAANPDERETVPAEQEPLQATPRIAFADEQAYLAWRNIFPLATEDSRSGKMKWEELCALLTNPPLSFAPGDNDTQIFKFHRPAQQ